LSMRNMSRAISLRRHSLWKSVVGTLGLTEKNEGLADKKPGYWPTNFAKISFISSIETRCNFFFKFCANIEHIVQILWIFCKYSINIVQILWNYCEDVQQILWPYCANKV
jgi:hypothetical protein